MLDSLKKELEKANNFEMFWCLMPLPQERLDEIEKSHQIRPYLVFKKDDNNLLGFYGTSQFKYDNNLLFHTLYQGDYKRLYKNTYFNLDKAYEIPKQNVKNKIGTLNDSDTKMVLEKISATYDSTDLKELKLGYCLIDNIGNLYYIYAIDESKAYGMLLKKSNNLDAQIKVNNESYNFDFMVEKKFDKKSNLKIIYMANIGRIVLINKLLSNYYASEESKNLQKGDIVSYNDKLYYIYDINSKNAFGLEVWVNKNDNDQQINVNESNYYTDFSKYKLFDRVCDIKIVNRATIEQNRIINDLKLKNAEELKKQEELFKEILKGIYNYYNLIKKGMLFKIDGNNYVYIYSDNKINFCINLDTYFDNPCFVEFDEVPVTHEYLPDDKVKDILKYLNRDNQKNIKTRRRKLKKETYGRV